MLGQDLVEKKIAMANMVLEMLLDTHFDIIKNDPRGCEHFLDMAVSLYQEAQIEIPKSIKTLRERISNAYIINNLIEETKYSS